MRTSLSPLLVVGALLATSVLPASAAIVRPSSSGNSSLHVELDGAPAGIFDEWSGGDQILAYNSDLSALSGVSIVPLQFGLPADPGPALQSLLRDFFQGSRTTHVLRMEEWTGDRSKPLTRADDVVVSELRLCALDAAETKTAGSSLVLVVTPGSVRADSGKVLIKDTGKARRTRGNFSVRISGGALPSSGDSSRISGYSDIVIRSDKGNPASVGPIVLKINPAFGASFAAWRDAVLAGDVTGNRRQMTLDFLDASMKGVQLSFAFKDVLPVRVARSADGGHLEIELTAKSVSLAAAPTAPAPGSGEPSASTEPTEPSEPSPATPVAPVDPATPVAPVEPSTPVVSPVSPLADRTLKPIADRPVVGSPVLAAVGDNADLGLRDPKEFPRPEGLVRQNFSNIDYVSSATEESAYTSKRPIKDLLEDYLRLLKESGWTRTRSSDSGAEPETRMILMDLQKGKMTADLRLYATKDGCKVSLLVKYLP